MSKPNECHQGQNLKVGLMFCYLESLLSSIFGILTEKSLLQYFTDFSIFHFSLYWTSCKVTDFLDLWDKNNFTIFLPWTLLCFKDHNFKNIAIWSVKIGKCSQFGHLLLWCRTTLQFLKWASQNTECMVKRKEREKCS